MSSNIMKKNLLSVIVPLLNEEETICETYRRLESLRISLLNEAELEFIFIDDGSQDRTFEILSELAQGKLYFKVAALSRNFGHQIAITAGIDIACGDYVAIIDGDLQDPPELIADMYRKALLGFDVVYGKRKSRVGETFFKKITALGFYRFLNYMCEMEIPKDTGDFRLMSRNVVEAFKLMRERHRFVRGMVPWLGFRAVSLEYVRDKRFAGVTKYPLRKMIAFAANAIFSFSSKPLTLAIRIGLLTIAIGFGGGLYILYMKIFTNIPVPGLTAILLSIVLFSGVQIFLIGVVGEYIARIFEEVKNRPLYILAKTINF